MFWKFENWFLSYTSEGNFKKKSFSLLQKGSEKSVSYAKL